MVKHFMILGGYGGVGRVLAQQLLQFTDAAVTIAGRRKEKAASFAQQLQKAFPNRQISAGFADATQKASLRSAFEKVDLVIVTATTPDFMNLLAEAAIETATDVLDILVRGDVVDQLEKYRNQIVKANRIFITQAGFHPGLMAPIIRYGREKFDVLTTANVVMAMNALFEKPESTHEIIHEIGAGQAKILKDGHWKKATYRDARSVQFAEKFGRRACFPLQMREIYPLAAELGLANMGVYSAGFNPFVDNLVFPLTLLLQGISPGLARSVGGKLMYWGVKKFYNHRPGIELQLQAVGIKDHQERSFTLTLQSDDPYAFTAMPIVACLHQYLDGTIKRPNLYLMGQAVDPHRILADLTSMGCRMEEKMQ